MLEFIEYPKCSTCKKAKNELNELGLEYKNVHIVEETPSEEMILDWLEKSGFELKQFFNTSGIKYREMGLKDKIGSLSKQDAAKLLASDGMLLKRPLLVENGILKQIGYRTSYGDLSLKQLFSITLIGKIYYFPILKYDKIVDRDYLQLPVANNLITGRSMVE